MEFATATSIGARCLVSSRDITTTRVRVRVIRTGACPLLSEVGLFPRP